MTRSVTNADALDADGSTCSATAARQKIYQYLARSAGTCNLPTDHCLRCFVGMIQTGEAAVEDMEAVGGQWLVDELVRVCGENGWSLTSE